MCDRPSNHSIQRTLSYIAGYLVLLVPTFFFAVIKWVDMADPPDPNQLDSFWVCDLGQWMWFGLAFALPAFVLLALSLAVRWIRRSRVRIQ
jgi:hypothetical protein